jgi:zinc protease
VDREQTTLTGRSHRDTLDAYVPLFTDAYLRPAFTEADFERLKSDAINYLANELRYASDEELAKAVLYQSAFAGSRYAHPSEGTVAGLEAITLDDVRTFYRTHYTRDNVLIALGGGFDDALAERLETTISALPPGPAPERPALDIARLQGRRVVLVDKPGADASISFGFPIEVRRGERDFYALWIANSWLGEHRNSASHLFQVIRETRGLNYGDYSYIEAFPEGGQRNMPPVNVPRRRQLFEVWIRTLPNEQALFALRAATRELADLVDAGLTAEEFELTRSFLKKYILHFADTTTARLGYAVDDRFYGLTDEGHLARFSRLMDELTVEDVNAAIERHLQYDDLTIAIVTGAAASLGEAIAADTPSPIDYASPMPDDIVEEDRTIERFGLDVPAGHITTITVDDAFAGR